MSKLVIVESPAKAKNIKGYLGKGYDVVASMGHVRDLPAARLSVDIAHDFAPKYAVIAGKENFVKDLKKKAQAADYVYLATDPDREGEAISWHLATLLGLDMNEKNRVTFNEITKKVVNESIAKPRAIDQNLVMMEKMKLIASRHDLVCLLHEKPFEGINGSGKHNNWSLGTDTGVNLFGPGKTASENLQFITFLVNAISAVYKFNGLLKASIMSATNAHRLGANEAPPAIISTFLGTQVSAVLDKLAASKGDDAIRFDAKNVFKMSGISHIPTLLLDNTDRNRTSPFAFTGNRFEFRAVGSSDNCAEAMIVLNSAMAYELTEFKKAVDAKIEAGAKKERAIYEVLKQMIKACKAVRFDGNGYSDEWKAEAKKRGLDCETSTPLIFERYLDKATLEMFSAMGVFTDVELEARTEVKWETYTKKIQIEGRVLGDLAMNHIVPIASKYEALLLDKVYKMSQIPGLNASADIALIKKIQYHTAEIQRLTGEMIDARKKANKIEQMREKAIAYHDTVSVFFDEIRRHIDKLEEIVDDQMWPLPKYRELLFLR